jgi:hypothetical protein
MGTRQKTRLAAMLAGALMTTTTATAQDARPDPAAVVLPDVSVDQNPKAVEDGFKFFYFHNPSVSFDEAYADIAECRSFLVSGAPAAIPGFRPWVEPVRHDVKRQYPGVGLLDMAMRSAIASIILPKLERGIRNNKLRRCMEPRGYARYPAPEAAWQTLNEGDEATLVAMQAKLASGARPNAAQVSE